MSACRASVVAAVTTVVATVTALAGCAGGGHTTAVSHPSPARPAAATLPPVSSTVPPATAPSTTPPPTTPVPTTVPDSPVPTTPTTPATTAPPTAPPTTPATTTCPASLASQLASTGGGSQLITAEGTGGVQATVTLWDRVGACWVDAGGPWPAMLGASGFSDHHAEGDDSTPTGLYAIGSVMYGNAPDPGVAYSYHQLVCGDWWDEDPSSPTYNTFQHVPCGQAPPFGGGSEALWTETAPYPIFAVIDYNSDPVVAGAGSAIFLHADTGGTTAGCVSIPLPDLDQLLEALRPADAPHMAMAPAGEITRF